MKKTSSRVLIDFQSIQVSTTCEDQHSKSEVFLINFSCTKALNWGNPCTSASQTDGFHLFWTASAIASAPINIFNRHSRAKCHDEDVAGGIQTIMFHRDPNLFLVIFRTLPKKLHLWDLSKIFHNLNPLRDFAADFWNEKVIKAGEHCSAPSETAISSFIRYSLPKIERAMSISADFASLSFRITLISLSKTEIFDLLCFLRAGNRPQFPLDNCSDFIFSCFFRFCAPASSFLKTKLKLSHASVLALDNFPGKQRGSIKPKKLDVYSIP